jgi:hypothetical protein
MFRHLLEQAGHEVHEAVDGLAGSPVPLRPDAAVIDIGLPGRLRGGWRVRRPADVLWSH